MKLPPLPVSSGVLETLISEIPPDSEILVSGNKKLASKLTLKGYKVHTVIDHAHTFKAVVFFNQIPDKHTEATEWIKKHVTLLQPDGIFYVIEKSTPMKENRGILARLLIHYGLLKAPEKISAAFLSTGMKQITQIWPQGFSSLVITHGVPSKFTPFK